MVKRKRPEADGEDEGDSGLDIGDNVGDRQGDIRRFARQIVEAKAAVKLMQGKVKAIRKEAQERGITLATLDLNIKLLEMTPDEQRVWFSDLHEGAEALHIAHVPIGAQLDLLDNADDPEVRARDWYSQGFAAATTGKGTYGVPPDNCPPEHRDDWLSGVHEGTTLNAPGQLDA